MSQDHVSRPGADVGDYALAFTLLDAVQTHDAPVRDWDALSADEQSRWAAVARATAQAFRECPGFLDADSEAEHTPQTRADLLDLLQCALAHVSNAVSLHRDISAALYTERRYRCPCGTCHFQGDAQCECNRCRAGEEQP